MCCSRPVSDLFRVSSDTVNWRLQVAGTVYRSAAVPQCVLGRMLEGRTFFPTKSDCKWVRCGRNGGSNRIGDHEVSTFHWSNESAKIPDNTLLLVELLVNQYVLNYRETHMFVCAYIFCQDSKIWCLFNLKMCTNIYVPIDLQAHFLIFRSISAEDRWRNVQVVQQCSYESGFQKSCHSGDVRWRWFQGFGVETLETVRICGVFGLLFTGSSRMEGPLVSNISKILDPFDCLNVDDFGMKSLLVYIVYMMCQSTVVDGQLWHWSLNLGWGLLLL